MLPISNKNRQSLKRLIIQKKNIEYEIQIICKTLIDEFGKEEKTYLLDDVNLVLIEKK